MNKISLQDYEGFHYDKEKLREACKWEVPDGFHVITGFLILFGLTDRFVLCLKTMVREMKGRDDMGAGENGTEEGKQPNTTILLQMPRLDFLVYKHVSLRFTEREKAEGKVGGIAWYSNS